MSRRGHRDSIGGGGRGSKRPKGGRPMPCQLVVSNGPRCQTCGAPATCFGTYEGITGYGCDTCCGHACEDGHCEPIDESAA